MIKKLKAALVDLESANAIVPLVRFTQSITDLRSVIAEMEAGEPVVKVVATMQGIYPTWYAKDWHKAQDKRSDNREISLYTHPQPKTEPTLQKVGYLIDGTHFYLVQQLSRETNLPVPNQVKVYTIK